MKQNEKRCPKCGRTMSLTNFGKHKDTKSGVSCYCKHCVSEASRLRRVKYPDENSICNWLNSGIPRKYVYLALRLKHRRKRRCDLCNVSESKFQRLLNVDHRHANGSPRGLLCPTCNSHIGWYERNKEIIEEYLAE